MTIPSSITTQIEENLMIGGNAGSIRFRVRRIADGIWLQVKVEPEGVAAGEETIDEMPMKLIKLIKLIKPIKPIKLIKLTQI